MRKVLPDTHRYRSVAGCSEHEISGVSPVTRSKLYAIKTPRKMRVSLGESLNVRVNTDRGAVSDCLTRPVYSCNLRRSRRGRFQSSPSAADDQRLIG